MIQTKDNQKRINIEKIAIIILTILLVVAIGYIVVGKYEQKQNQMQLSVYQQGIQYGYEQAIIQIIQQSSTCRQVPLIIGNQTINLIAVECLKVNTENESVIQE